ncbi:protein DYAD isoform X3 [Vigna radiata var. radiata]|uniref:Protein DYAD isoform X3 n=1 Tax=Vigna radiata var. radiata TaxID=3916 RepID=A0A3Q0FBV5_VIGRR|nr:protein DYAD isoform X3 [Vigna radiata var. radiata]
MGHLGVSHQVKFIGQHKESGSKLSSSIPTVEESNDKENITKGEPIFMPKFKKRKRLSLNRLREIKADMCASTRESSSGMPETKSENRDRWSTKRYMLAEQSMWEVLKGEGATFENPISLPALRMAVRKHIGDTGLLDHLLKHIDGRLAPGGTERFRRRFNTKGIMEYWSESANLDEIHQETGMQNPYQIQPSKLRAGSVPMRKVGSIDELKMLKIEMAQMKRDMQELIARKKVKRERCLVEETQKSFANWKAMTEERVTEILTFLKGVQGMNEDLLICKTKVEQQLMEIANKLSDVRTLRELTTSNYLSTSWEDWLESTNLDNIHGNEFSPWFGNPELLDVPQEIVLQEPNSVLPIQLQSVEQTIMKSNLQDLVPKKIGEDQPNVILDSSSAVNSKSDLDKSMILCQQEMFLELFTSRDKMEQQLLEISNTVYGMLTSE